LIQPETALAKFQSKALACRHFPEFSHALMTPQQSISAYTGHPHCIRESLGLSIKFHENGLPQPIENGAKSWKNLAGGAID